METQRASAEKPGQRVEIFHNEDSDVVLNKDNQEWPVVLGDIPEILGFLKESDKGKVYEYGKGRIAENAYDYPVEDPRYFIKQKFMSAPSLVRESREILADNPDRLKYPKKTMDTWASVLGELSLALNIKNILTTPVANDIAHRFGYNQIALVEALAAVVRRETGSKFLIYNQYNFPDATLVRDSRLPVALVSLFRESGIEPSDLSQHNLKDDPRFPGTLFLIDTEAYTRISNEN